MLRRAGINFSDSISDWRIYQRTHDNCADILVKGSFNDKSYPYRESNIQVRLVYENNGEIVDPRFINIAINVKESGNWEALLKDVPAGGLYRFEMCSYVENGFPVIHNIAVGDIWVVGGQSNAAGFSGGIIEDPPLSGVHKYTGELEWEIATHPLGNGWGHSPFLHFGKILYKTLNMPIGLIPVAIGGSYLKEWNPDEGDAPYYYRMINMIKSSGGNIKGLLWYQGCSDTNDDKMSETYYSRFNSFLKRLKSDLNYPELPVIVAQLNRFKTNEKGKFDINWSIMREQQRQLQYSVNTAVIPTLDLSLCDCIHTSAEGNMILGQRFANAALGMVYGCQKEWRAPDVMEAIVGQCNDEVIVKLNNVSDKIFNYYDPIGDFMIEDCLGEILIKDIYIEGKNTIKIKLMREIHDKALIHNAYGVDPDISLRRSPDLMPILGFYGKEIATGKVDH